MKTKSKKLTPDRHSQDASQLAKRLGEYNRFYKELEKSCKIVKETDCGAIRCIAWVMRMFPNNPAAGAMACCVLTKFTWYTGEGGHQQCLAQNRTEGGYRARGFKSIRALAAMLGWGFSKTKKSLEDLEHSPYFSVDFKRCLIRPKIFCLLNRLAEEWPDDAKFNLLIARVKAEYRAAFAEWVAGDKKGIAPGIPEIESLHRLLLGKEYKCCWLLPVMSRRARGNIVIALVCSQLAWLSTRRKGKELRFAKIEPDGSRSVWHTDTQFAEELGVSRDRLTYTHKHMGRVRYWRGKNRCRKTCYVLLPR